MELLANKLTFELKKFQKKKFFVLRVLLTIIIRSFSFSSSSLVFVLTAKDQTYLLTAPGREFFAMVIQLEIDATDET